MQGAVDYSLIALQPDPDSQEWWAAAREQRLLVRSCAACGQRWFPPSPLCPVCRSFDLAWHEAEGRGVIASYVVVAHSVLPAFREAAPYVVALVELPDCANEDGDPVRLPGVLLDGEDAAGVGARVEVAWEQAPDGSYTVPAWRALEMPAAEAASVWRLDAELERSEAPA